MKKILVALLLAVFAIPAMADVAITATDEGTGHLKISILPSGGAVVRGVALKLSNTDGAIIDATTDVTTTQFNTFIDYAFNGSVDPYVVGAGHPIADPAGAGVATLPASTFVLSAGYLDEGGNQGGIAVESFFDVFFDLTQDSTINIELDTLRGGIVGDTLGNVTVEASQLLIGTPPVYYNLTTATTTGGTVTTPGIGVFPYLENTVAPIVATPNANWFFWKWTGDAVASATSASTTVTMNANKAVTANFTFACQQFNFTKLVSGATDNAVTVADMNLMIAWVNANKTGTTFAVSSTNPAWNPNGPIYNMTKKMGAVDNAVTVADLNAFISFVNNRKTGTTFAVNCATCGC